MCVSVEREREREREKKCEIKNVRSNRANIKTRVLIDWCIAFKHCS